MKIRNLLTFAAVLLGMACPVMAQDAAPEGDAMGGEPAAAPAADTAAPAEGGEAAASTEDIGASEGPAKKISAGLLLGYGISLESGKNPFGLGIGVRGGYNLGAIYLGARFVYSIGEDPVTSWDLGIEGGYDLSMGDKLTLRPQLGLGIDNMTVDVPSVTVPGVGSVGGGSSSSSEFYIAPGASVIYDVTDDIFLGGEVRLQLITSDPMYKALTIYANGGMRF